MVKSNQTFLEAELMDVVRLFRGAKDLTIENKNEYSGGVFFNSFTVDGEEFSFSDEAEAPDPLAYKSLCKRYAKLALYKILSEKFQKTLPWGALTGIRPTKLAYMELGHGRDFRPLFKDMGVSEENISLVARTIEEQKGIYEVNGDYCDLFVSLPFCPTKCVYCSFITAPIEKTRGYLPDYLIALQREIEELPPIKKLRSVYVGGGTPFVLSAQELDEVLSMVDKIRTNGCEFTVEAGRPDVFTEEKLEVCKKHGVTRICINAQSFSDKTLQAIGRKHTAAQVYEAFEMAKPFGFTVNCDLIAGLTGETYEEFCASVDAAISLSPENITVHTLCLKKGSRLKEEVSSLEEGELAKMIDYSRKTLTMHGYAPYYMYRQKYMAGSHENVGWTKKGFASVYNIDIMEEIADNLAVGSNAVSKKVFVREGRIERCASPKDLPTYLASVDKVIAEKKRLWEE